MAVNVKPFPVDAEVMAAIRPMQNVDAPRVAELHHAAMGNSLWAKLGIGFLTELYRGLIDNPRFLGFVYMEDGQIGGFIAGTTDAAAMMREVFKSRWIVLGVAAWMLYHNLALGLVMTGAMTLNLLLAAVMGVGIPLAMTKLGRDPAVGSSVMITAVTDSGGFFIFLGLATLFLI